MNNTISVIICAYTEKRWPYLVAAIVSIQQQTRPADEIIVVIDHNPLLLERIHNHFPSITAVANTNEKGLSGARNMGVTLAKNDLIAFLDDDATAVPTWLEYLTAHFENTAIMGVGSRIEPLWEKSAGWFPSEFNWVVGCTYLGMPETSAPVRNLIGAGMCIRREVFETVGGFRSGMGRINAVPMGCEETELCIRASQRWPERLFVYEPRACIHHHVPAQRATWRYFYSRCYAEGLSKAMVAHLVGARDGLSSERNYTMRTLPLGVLRGLRKAILHHDQYALARASAIVAGLGITTFGYLRGMLAQRRVSVTHYAVEVTAMKES